MAPESTSRGGWYAKRFKNALAPELLKRIKDDAPSPLLRPGGKPPTPFTLGAVFAGAGRYTQAELSAAVSEVSGVEVGIRQKTSDGLPYENVTVWLSRLIGAGAG